METTAAACRAALALLTLLSVTTCSKSPAGVDFGEILLQNGSFEIHGRGSLDGWSFGNRDLAELVEDAAPNGGNWSLQLAADWAPTSGFAFQSVTGLAPGSIVRLSAFVRGVGPSGGCGILELTYHGRTRSARSCTTSWTRISVVDTLVSTEPDTLWVRLSSPVTEVVPFRQQFDLVKLAAITG